MAECTVFKVDKVKHSTSDCYILFSLWDWHKQPQLPLTFPEKYILQLAFYLAATGVLVEILHLLIFYKSLFVKNVHINHAPDVQIDPFVISVNITHNTDEYKCIVYKQSS